MKNLRALKAPTEDGYNEHPQHIITTAHTGNNNFSPFELVEPCVY